MTDLRSVLQAHVSNGSLPGAVGLLARGDSVEFAARRSQLRFAQNPRLRPRTWRRGACLEANYWRNCAANARREKRYRFRMSECCSRSRCWS